MELDQIYLLINKQQSGDITEEDSKILQSWLEESQRNRQLADQIKKIWLVSGSMRLDLDLNTKVAWERISAQTGSQGKTRFLFRPPTWVRVAASVLILVSVGVVYYLMNSVDHQVFQTGLNERKLLVLPDNSKVWLNENSRLTYEMDFQAKRHLSLDGEAYFEVTKNPSNPFVIESPSILTTVIGTSFNVRADDEREESEVMVTSGKVMVNARLKGSDTVFLEPGTKVTYHKLSAALKKSINENLNVLAWKERRILFQNTSLKEVENVLERYFDVDIEFKGEKLGICQFTGDFNDPLLEEVLEVLSVTLDLSYSHTNDRYLIEGSGCADQLN